MQQFYSRGEHEVNPFGDSMPRTEVRELWDLAITKYSGFPIFTRRYISHGLENFAFDAFLGKPCFLVAHHDVFKDNARELTIFVQSLNALHGGVYWRSLDDAIKRSYLTRENADGTIDVRMFANEMVLENRSASSGKTVITKREIDADAIKSVHCGQQEVEWSCTGGWLRFPVEIRPGQTAKIKVEYLDPFGESASSEGLKYRIKCLPGVTYPKFVTTMSAAMICSTTVPAGSCDCSSDCVTLQSLSF